MLKTNGKWWRCSQYQISGGRICAVPNATVQEYDPWATCSAIDGASREVERPYSSLLRLALQLRRDPPRGELREGQSVAFGLSHAMSDAVLDWCGRFGLIGIDPLRFAMNMAMHNAAVLFSPVPANAERDLVGPTIALNDLMSIYRLFSTDRISRWEAVPSTQSGSQTEEGTPTTHRDDIDLMKIDLESAQIGVARYWLGYSEPIDSFVALIWRLLDAAETLVDLQTRHKAVRNEERSGHVKYLSVLANTSVRYRTMIDSNEFAETELAPAILSSFARMMLDDFDSGQRFFFSCDTCGTIIVSEDLRTKYCSLKCRKAMMMRKYRGRKQQQRLLSNPVSEETICVTDSPHMSESFLDKAKSIPGEP
jgi:hypothetical protein